MKLGMNKKGHLAGIRSMGILAVLLMLIAIAGCGGEQDAPPNPGTILEFTNITPSSLTVNWTKATDDNTLQPYLEYKVVYSVFDNLGTVDAALARSREVPLLIENSEGEEVEVTWVQNSTSIDVKDLDDGIEYFFNVVVRDRYWNAAVYTPASAKTVDVTAPAPGNAGLLAISDETNDSGNISLTLSWTKASDNNTSGPDVLEYRVVYSDSNNIGTVNSALENDVTPLDKQVWTTDIGSTVEISDDYISNLPEDTCHFFNVLVRDETGNIGIYQTISQAPTAGDDGELTISGETVTGVTLNWTKATDSENDPSQIEYRVVYSTSDDIDSVENAEDNDDSPHDWGDAWVEKDVNLKRVTDLAPGATYYFNVIIRDIAGVKAVYETITNAPTPGGRGRLFAENITETSFTLSWALATDSGSNDENLTYEVFQSFTDNISTIAEIETNGGAPIGQGHGIDYLDISGLNPTTDYYFNVLVTDDTGHQAAYTIMSLTSLSRESTSLTRTFSSMPSDSPDNPHSGRSVNGQPDMNSLVSMQNDDAVYEVDNNSGDLMLWLDGCDVNGDGSFFQGTRPALWTDKTIYGNSALQADAKKRPILLSSPLLNGKPVVRFDADRGDFMAIDFNGVVDDVNDYTMFMVADFKGAAGDKTDGLSGGGSCFTAIDANGNIWGLETLYIENDLFFIITDGEYDICSILNVPDKPAILTILSEGGFTDDLVLNVNGDQERLSGFTKKDALKSLSLGALKDSVQEGESLDFGYFSGDIAEFIVFKRALTEDEQQRITAYLSKKWGIQLSQ